MIMIGALCLVIVLLIGGSYAFFTAVYKSDTENKVYTGTFEVTYQSDGGSIQLTNAYPMTDAEGKKTPAFTFEVANKGNIDSKYQIDIVEDSTNTLNKNLLKYTLKKNSDTEPTPKILTNTTLVSQALLAANKTDTYEFKLWLDEKATNQEMGKIWKGKIKITAIESVS